MLIAALQNAGRGLNVFAVRANQKRPLRKGWQQEATRDGATLIELFDGARCNIGVSTAGLCVVDADAGKGGLETLKTLGDLPPTYTVRTPSGGLHLYYKPRGAERYKTDVEVFPGIDIRAEGGLVVGAGSAVNGVEYRVINDGPIAEIPEHLAARIKAHEVRPKWDGKELVHDMRGAEEQARRYLTTVAPFGEEGSRNNAAFVVAARCVDYGCTWQTTAALMAELWDCDPPLDDDELETVCRSAARNRSTPPGADNAWLGFEPVTNDAHTAVVYRDTEERIKRVILTPESIAALPPRKWIVARRLVRGKVSMLIADAGVGKTTLALQWACAVAEGGDAAKRLGLDVRESVPVLVLNGEDELDEMDRRIAAISQKFGVSLPVLGERLWYTSGSQNPWTFVVRGSQRDTLAETPQVDALIKYLRERSIGLLVIDPLVETHEADENKNPEMKRVMGVFRRIAESADCAVLVVHHSRKPSTASSEGSAGNLASARGASAMGGVARIVFTLYAMSDADGERYGIPQANRHKYVRLDDAKFNLGLASPRAQWHLRWGEVIACGEEIGVLPPVDLTDKTAENHGVLLDVLARMCVAGESLTVQECAKRVAADPMAAGVTVNALVKRLIESFGALGHRYEAHGVTLTYETLAGSGGLVRCL